MKPLRQSMAQKPDSGCAAPVTSPGFASPPIVQHLRDDLRDVETGGIDNLGVSCCLQRRYAARTVPRVTLADVLQDQRNISIYSVFDQLFITPFGTGVLARGQKNLELRTRKHDGTHVPAIGNQAG